MDKDFAKIGKELGKYVEETFSPEDSILLEIRKRSLEAGLPEIQVGRIDVRHLEIISAMMRAEKIVEIGTLGGYSAVSLARGMQPHGQIHTFEYEARYAEVAKKSFELAGISDRTHVYVGEALKNLAQIEDCGR